jgi:hypothetical protein
MSGDRAAAAALIRCAIRDRVRRTGTYVRFRLRIALHALGQPAFLCRIAFRQKQNLIAPGSRSERASSQRVVKVASEISPRDDELKMLDAAMSRIMGDLDIPDLPPEVRAPLKLELGVLVQMWFDLHGERQKSSSIQIRTVLLGLFHLVGSPAGGAMDVGRQLLGYGRRTARLPYCSHRNSEGSSRQST